MSRHQKPSIAWDLRSRTNRKRGFIRIQNQIRANTPQLGGLFTTHDVIQGNSWADIYFTSDIHRLRLYNATIDTALYAYASRCEELAWSNSEKLLPPEQETVSMSELFVKDPASGYYTLSDSKPSTIEREMRAFGGLRLYEWINQEAARVADTGDVWISPMVRLDFSYGFGVGLMSTVSDNELTIANLDEFVVDFRERGENPYVIDSIKLSFPSSRLKEACSVNAISLEPKEWATAQQQSSSAQTALAREEREALSSASLPASAPKRPTSL